MMNPTKEMIMNMEVLHVLLGTPREDRTWDEG